MIDALSVEMITDSAGVDRLQQAWDDLYEVSPCSSPALSWDWARGWWRHYSEAYSHGDGSLRVGVVRRGPTVVAILPLYLRGRPGKRPGLRRLGFVSTGEDEIEETCPDYMNILAVEGEEQACVRAVGDELMRIRRDWDVLELDNIPFDSPLTLLTDQWATSFPIVETVPRGACPRANLASGFEAFIGSLSSNARQQSRRQLRESDRAGATLVLAKDPPSIEWCFDELIRLHTHRWNAVGKPGVFARPRFTEFHRELCRKWVPDGQAALAVLKLGDSGIAAIYGFLHKGKFDSYILGTTLNPGGAIQSPGMALQLMLMRELAARGLHTFDHLQGSRRYKKRLSTTAYPLVQLRFVQSRRQAVTERAVGVARALKRRLLGARPA